MELVPFIEQYWAAIAALATMSFTIGRLWSRVDNSVKATSNLYNAVKLLNDFKILQENQNHVINERFANIEEERNNHLRDAASRFESLVGRIDGLFRLLAEKGKG